MSWEIQGHQAIGTRSNSARPEHLHADLTRPDQGVQWTLDSLTETWAAISGNLFSAPAAKIEESYVRGDDLVVHHAESDTTRLSTTIYRRILAPASDIDSFAWELVIAVRTSTLGVQPNVSLSGHCAAAVLQPSIATLQIQSRAADSHPLTWLDAGPISRSSTILKLADGSFRAVWLHPSDGRSSVHHDSSGTHVITALDLECLEKGVIRSARIGFERFPAGTNTAQLAAAFERFVESDLPLTT